MYCFPAGFNSEFLAQVTSNLPHFFLGCRATPASTGPSECSAINFPTFWFACCRAFLPPIPLRAVFHPLVG